VGFGVWVFVPTLLAAKPILGLFLYRNLMVSPANHQFPIKIDIDFSSGVSEIFQLKIKVGFVRTRIQCAQHKNPQYITVFNNNQNFANYQMYIHYKFFQQRTKEHPFSV